MTDHENPFWGQCVREVNFGEPTWYEENVGEYRPVVQSIELGTVVTSEVADASWLPTGKHKPVLDIDLPVKVLDSSTPGHHHLFIDKEMTWDEYDKLLTVLVKLGIVEPGFRNASQHRQHTAVRLPWVKKKS